MIMAEISVTKLQICKTMCCKAEKTMRRIERSKPFENMLYLSGRKDAGGVSCLDYHQEQKLLQNR